MKTPDFNPGVDVYITKTQPFAQPILTHLRELIHKGCPEVEESIKWSRPFFELNGIILANIAGFKQHCSLGIWGEGIRKILIEDGVVFEGAMGTFGRITSLKDLPPDKVLVNYIRQSAAMISSGERTKSYSRPPKAARPAPEMPEDLAAALKKSKPAAKVFAAFTPSQQREYTDWITEAKRPETRQQRIAQSVEWIAEGKQRNWKYQNC